MQDGESNDKVHSFVRIQFHHNTQYDARTANPSAALIKELAFRSTNSTAAQKFVQVLLLTPFLVPRSYTAFWLTLQQRESCSMHAGNVCLLRGVRCRRRRR